MYFGAKGFTVIASSFLFRRPEDDARGIDAGKNLIFGPLRGGLVEKGVNALASPRDDRDLGRPHVLDELDRGGMLASPERHILGTHAANEPLGAVEVSSRGHQPPSGAPRVHSA